MLLNIKTGHRGILKRPQDEIVFIVCEVFDIVKHCNQWVFTDGHPKTKITGFYNNLKYLNELNWETINSKLWKNTDENPDRMRQKQAEFMVYNHIPVQCIKGLIVKNNKQKSEINQIVAKLDMDLAIYIDEKCNYYY